MTNPTHDLSPRWVRGMVIVALIAAAIWSITAIDRRAIRIMHEKGWSLPTANEITP